MKIAQVSMGSSVQLTIGGRKSEYLSLNAKNANVDIEFSQGVFTVTCLATRKKTCFGLTNAKWWDPLEVEDAAELTEPVATAKTGGPVLGESKDPALSGRLSGAVGVANSIAKNTPDSFVAATSTAKHGAPHNFGPPPEGHIETETPKRRGRPPKA